MRDIDHQLWLAVDADDARRAERLLREGADAAAPCNGGSHILAASRSARLYEMLRQAGATEPPVTLGITPLMRAAGKGARSLVELLLDEGAPIFARDFEGKTAFDYAYETQPRLAAAMLSRAGVLAHDDRRHPIHSRSRHRACRGGPSRVPRPVRGRARARRLGID